MNVERTQKARKDKLSIVGRKYTKMKTTHTQTDGHLRRAPG